MFITCLDDCEINMSMVHCCYCLSVCFVFLRLLPIVRTERLTRLRNMQMKWYITVISELNSTSMDSDLTGCFGGVCMMRSWVLCAIIHCDLSLISIIIFLQPRNQ